MSGSCRILLSEYNDWRMSQTQASFSAIVRDMPLSADALGGHSERMRKKRRQRIDALIDAHVWLRRGEAASPVVKPEGRAGTGIASRGHGDALIWPK
jgi:hypothetical protein